MAVHEPAGEVAPELTQSRKVHAPEDIETMTFGDEFDAAAMLVEDKPYPPEINPYDQVS